MPAPFVSGGPAMLGRPVTALAPLLAVLAGLAGSVQVAVMARLGERVGVFAALAWAAMLTAGLALVLLLVVRQGLGGVAGAARPPAPRLCCSLSSGRGSAGSRTRHASRPGSGRARRWAS